MQFDGIPDTHFVTHKMRYFFHFSCCSSNPESTVNPVFCFEKNGCMGLQWNKRNKVCSAELLATVGMKILKMKDISVDSKEKIGTDH